MISLKASPEGLTKIKQARKEKGWNLNDVRWLEKASEVLGVVESEKLAPGISYGTWKRFLGGKKPINENAFKAYCQVLELDWQKVVVDNYLVPNFSHQDWGEAIDVSIFFGRTDELATLQKWIVKDRCRSILLLGIGGIGKTALSIKIAQLVQSEFDFVIWRSLRNAPSLSELLSDTIQFISVRQETNLPAKINQKINLLLKYLRKSKCLLILDNVESILETNALKIGSYYRQGYESYGQLFKVIGETQHQSCLLITSREKPQNFYILEGENLQVRSLQLTGIKQAEAKDIFQTKGLFEGSENDWQKILERYGGNPLALKIVASTIQDFFEGNITEFLNLLQQGFFICDDIYLLLQQQFQRLDRLEKQIMYWLAINRKPVSLSELQADLVETISIGELTKALMDLKNRSLIETQDGKYTQQPVVMEYAIDEFINNIQTEIVTGKIKLFNSHAIIQAQTEEYIRDSQIFLILQPLIDKLVFVLGSAESIEARLKAIIKARKLQSQPGYLSGNIINLLRQLNIGLSGYDFSGLTVWQANLQSLPLHKVNFRDCDLSQSVFSETLGNIFAVAFNPQTQIFATGDNCGNVSLWDIHTGKLVSAYLGHFNWTRGIAFSPDGEYIVSGGGDRIVKVWHLKSNQTVATFDEHRDEVFTVGFSPCGSKVVSGSGDKTVRLWDLKTKKCLKTLTGHQNWVRSVAFSADGEILASGSADRTLRLWQVETGECLHILSEHQDWVRSVAFSPDGKIVASGSGDRTIKLWDVKTGKCLQTYIGHSSGVYAIAFSFDGQMLASGSGDCTIRLWELKTNRCLKTIYGHNNQIISLDFSPDNQTLACASLDRKVKLWQISTAKCLRTLQGGTDWAFPLAFSPTRENLLLASASSDYSVRLWQSDRQVCSSILKGHTDRVLVVAFSLDGKLLASGGVDRSIRLWNVNCQECNQILLGHEDWIRAIVFHPDGKTLISSSADDTIRLWDIDTGTHAVIHAPQVWSQALSSNGDFLITGSSDRTLKLWDLATRKCLQTYITEDCRAVYSVALNPDGTLAFSGSADNKIRCWSIKNIEFLGVFEGHQGFVFSLAVSPDGKMLVSGSGDRTVKLWDIKTGKCLRTFSGHTNKVWSVAFSDDGKIIASGSQDQSVRLWNAANGQCIQIFRPKRLYEAMNITGVKGLTEAQQETLKMLGAITNA